MQPRQINLNEINTRICLLSEGQEKSVKALLASLSSEVLSIDRRVREVLRLSAGELGEHDSHTSKEIQPVESRLTNEYVSIAEDLRALASVLQRGLTTSFSLPERITNELVAIGDDVLKMSEAVPDFRYTKLSKNLYSLCHALGGLSIKIGQSMLPTSGLEEFTATVEGEAEKKEVKDTGGICAGMHHQWVSECVESGTPGYPVASTMAVMHKQKHQLKLLTTDYLWENETEKFATFNARDKFERMVVNAPYAVSLLQKKGGGHAVGIRKHQHYIELFDPNFGYFFFKDVQSAGSWFSLLLQSYSSIDFPCEEIFFSMYAAKRPADIPVSVFPTREMIEKNVLTPDTEVGYKQIMAGFASHLALISRKASNEKLVDLVLRAITSLHPWFEKKEREHLVDLLLSVTDEAVSVSDEAHRLMGVSLHDRLKAVLKMVGSENIKNKMLGVISMLRHANDKKDYVSNEAQAVILRVDTATKSLIDRVNEIRTQLYHGHQGERFDKLTVAAMTLEEERLKVRLESLLKLKIKSKLISAHNGRLDYDVTRATKEIDDILISSLDVNQLQQHLSLISDLDMLKSGFTKHKDYLNNRVTLIDSEANQRLKASGLSLLENFGKLTFDEQYQMNKLKDKVVLIDQQLARIADLRKRIVANHHTPANEAELIEYFGQIVNHQQTYFEWVDALYHMIYKPKYSEEDVSKLKSAMEFLSGHEHPSFIGQVLSAINNKNQNGVNRRTMYELLDKAVQLHGVIITAIDLSSNFKLSVDELSVALFEMAPFCFREKNSKATLDVSGLNAGSSSYLNFTGNFPGRVLALAKEAGNSRVVKRCELLIKQYDAHSLSLIKCINDICNEINLSVTLYYHDVSDELLRKHLVVSPVAAKKKVENVVEMESVYQGKSSDEVVMGSPELIELNEGFIRDLDAEIKRIEKSKYGHDDIRKEKVNALNLLKDEVLSSSGELSDIINKFKNSMYGDQTFYDLICTQRRASCLSSLFNPAATTTQKLLDRYTKISEVFEPRP